MGFGYRKKATNILVLAMAVFGVLLSTPGLSRGSAVSINKKAVGFGIIKGVVRDRKGKPISKATVAVFRLGSSKLLKQVTATKSGKFFAKIIPGTYTVLAVAQGFNPVTLKKVKVGRSSELTYGFRLERAGFGKTLPEKSIDRNSPKWAIRAARRSIYQATEGNKPIDESSLAVNKDVTERASDTEYKRSVTTVVETSAGAGKTGLIKSVSFATLRPVGENAELLVAGQLTDRSGHGERLETAFSFSPIRDHRVRLRGSFSNHGDLEIEDRKESLSQISFQASDQWNIKEGIVLLFGVDYSRFVGAGDAVSLTPRIGVQYDLDSKTRVRSAYTTRTEERTWSKVIQLENSQILFADPVATEDISVQSGEAQMNQSTRFEIGVERVLDNRSSIEANVFFDTVKGRGVGLGQLPFSASKALSSLVGRHDGEATGMRVVVNRRLDSVFSASTGYSFGTGQRLSQDLIKDPSSVFENGLFQTIFGQLKADFKSGTTVKTVFRFSPQATVFAIDPFEGRLAIYDPGLSVLVTQSLPSLGLPFDAEATLDARNLFDFSGSVSGRNGSTFLNSQRRMVRGSILVRF
jgi:hypothetical protein